MLYASLNRVPNQRVSYIVNGYVITFEIQYFRNLMFFSATSSVDEVIVRSTLATNKGWLFPSQYESKYGNFRFEDDNGEYPIYTNFNNTCVLVYYTEDEIKAMRADGSAN